MCVCVCNIMAEGFRFIYLVLGLVRLRTFRLSAWVRCKHERRCSCTRGADVSFRDVTIKIPDRGCDLGCEWRHAPEAWAEICEMSVSWYWDLGEARRICALWALRVSGVESWRCKSSQYRKIMPLSSLCRKTFKLKGNKKFCTWTKKS